MEDANKTMGSLPMTVQREEADMHAGTETPPAPISLVRNGAFDSGPADWTSEPGEERAIVVDDSEFHNANCCLRIEHVTGKSDSTVSQVVDLEPDTEYTASFWIKAENLMRSREGAGALLRLRDIETGDTLRTSEVHHGSFIWKKVALNFHSQNQTRARVELGLGQTQGRVWFDEVKIVRGTTGEGLSPATAQEKDNVARGKACTVWPPPRSAPDIDGTTQLTDGRCSEGFFWVQDACLVWYEATDGVNITVDLGRVEPINGVSFSTAGGQGGVNWPSVIEVFASEDGDSFHHLGDLTELTEGPLPDPSQYGTCRYQTESFKTKGRYVRLHIMCTGRYVCCDQIEVYRGDDTFLALPYPEPPVTVDDLYGDTARRLARLTAKGYRRRLRLDLERVDRLIADATLDPKEADLIRREVELLTEAIRKTESPSDPERFRAIVPFNELHRSILQLHSKLLLALGCPPLSLWHAHRHAPLDLFAQPESGSPSLHVTMMLNEYRSDVFNLTNATAEQMKVRFRIQGLPGGDNPDYVQVHEVDHVDTREAIVSASALPRSEKDGDAYVTLVPSGMTRQIWLSFHPKDLKPGDYHGAVLVRSNTVSEQIPLRLSVVPITFPDRPDFSCGMWDYVDICQFGLTLENREAAIGDMSEHFVDTAWGTSDTIPYPEPEDVDTKGDLVRSLDFSKFDAWVKMRPDARYFILLSGDKLRGLNLDSTFAGLKRGSAAFNRALAQWAKVWAQHNREIGLAPGQVGLLLVDEPGPESYYRTTLDWARPIKQGSSEILLFCDPSSGKPWETESGEAALNLCDIVSPQRRFHHGSDPDMKNFFRRLQDKGAKLWFYDCQGPTRFSDPTSYYRLQPWYCFIHGAVGSSFWAYGDTGGTSSSWNEYTGIGRQAYAPIFAGPDDIVASKHWEAAREGIEDYQYLKMLRDKVVELQSMGVDNSSINEAAELLEALPEEAMARVSEFGMFRERDITFLDEARMRVLRSLIQLSGMASS